MKNLIILAAIGAMLSGTAMAQASQYDGEYGNAAGTIGTGGSCGTTRFGFRLSVKNGQASMRTATAGTLEGAVRTDGAVQILQGTVTLSGKITGNKFNGDLAFGSRGATCHFALDYTKFG